MTDGQIRYFFDRRLGALPAPPPFYWQREHHQAWLRRDGFTLQQWKEAHP